MTWSDVGEKLNGLHRDLGFAEYTSPFAHRSKLDVTCMTFALMVGTAGLPHVIVRFYTTPSVRAARWSGFWALLFIAILYTTAPALAIFARTNLLESLHGARIAGREQLDVNGVTGEILLLQNAEGESIEWATSWQRTGLLGFDDLNGDEKLDMRSVDGKFAEAPKVDRDIMVLATPEVARLAPWVIALVATGGLAAALSTAAGLMLVISSSIAHDLYVHFIDPEASEAKRVQFGRVAIAGAILVAGYFGVNPPGFVAQVVAFAFGLAAASFFPVILLGIFDQRTNREGAIAGMVTGLTFTAVYIVGNRSDVIFGTSEPWMGPWCFGISPEGIGAVGCLLNFVVALVVSRATNPPPAEVQALVEQVRIPRGSHEPETHFDEQDM